MLIKLLGSINYFHLIANLFEVNYKNLWNYKNFRGNCRILLQATVRRCYSRNNEKKRIGSICFSLIDNSARRSISCHLGEKNSNLIKLDASTFVRRSRSFRILIRLYTVSCFVSFLFSSVRRHLCADSEINKQSFS